jgi:hypothetical protein
MTGNEPRIRASVVPERDRPRGAPLVPIASP